MANVFHIGPAAVAIDEAAARAVSTGQPPGDQKAARRALQTPERAARLLASFTDPRLYQIAVLSSLLVFGAVFRAFEISPAHFAGALIAALAAQYVGALLNAMRFDARSPVITALSLTLLLRADNAGVMALAAAVAVGSKFVFRAGGKHVFNPANIGIVVVLLMSSGVGGGVLEGAAWTSPGRWGTALWLAALLAGAGVFVSSRAARLDVPLIFLGTFAALLIARALWLDDPLAIPLNRLQSGALVLFAFFMISDPKTTPDGARARGAFAALTALLSYVLIHHFHIADGIFYALAAMCLVRPLMELADPAAPYHWARRRGARNMLT